MTKKLVGQVTPEEKDEIQRLFERRNGLNELAMILTPDKEELYEKLVKDMGETGVRFQQWWNTASQKYNWEMTENGNWEINFETCEIFLVTPYTTMNTLLFIGTSELLLIGGLALLLFGGKKLPEMMRGLGKGVKEFKEGLNAPPEQPKDAEAQDDESKEGAEIENQPKNTDTPEQK